MAERSAAPSDMMTTREVAAYLRIKERKVYDLVKEGRIPCRRVTGKWLFPRSLIDAWLAGRTIPQDAVKVNTQRPPVVAGSHDPLLEWCLRESGCGLAMLAGGSLDGLARFAAGEVLVCGLHLFDPSGGGYNLGAVRDRLALDGLVLLEWAWREQGLVLAEGNPLGIGSLADLAKKRARIVLRQSEAGSRVLFEHLLNEAGITLARLSVLERPARSESDLALAVLDGRADAGLAIAEVARQHRLHFLPLHRERYDLVLSRRDYFEPAFQVLWRFVMGPTFEAHAATLAGYDCSGRGRAVFNGP